MSTSPIAGQLAVDATSLDKLKREAREDPRAALKAAAQQFEAVFLSMVLKAMRDATPQDGLMGSEQGRMYTQMLDQQLAQTLSAGGATGLTAVIERQLAQGLPAKAGGAVAGIPEFGPPLPGMEALSRSLTGALGPKGEAAAIDHPGLLQDSRPPLPVGGHAEEVDPHVRDFVSDLWPHALKASQVTGIPPHFMIAQAALETGWGRHEPRHADGRPSHNLFGIKAGKSWSGPVVETTTTEFESGHAQSRVERFRAYASRAAAFDDYARLLSTNPRYAGVIGQRDAAAFAQGLQRAGYATDPGYADKLTRIIGGTTLRVGLAG